MGYKSMSIRDVLSAYEEGGIILPAIQRNYVWQEDQILALFDSLMKGYPVGTFLFWEVKDHELESFVFNSFLKDIDLVDQKVRGAEIEDESGSFLSVLDGQQRITSLLVGLSGSYRSKVKKERKVDGDYPKRYLCINPLFVPEDSSESYDFRFLSQEEINGSFDGKWWIKLSDILALKDSGEVYHTFILKSDFSKSASVEDINLTMTNVPRLISVINDDTLLSYYTAAGRSIEDVVKIFERVNNNGKAVSGVDLMLSLATVASGNEDMQTKIEASIRRVSAATPSSNSFVPDKNFILTAALLALQADSLSTSSVQNFAPKRVAKIYEIWDDIVDAICNASIYIDRLGFDGKKLRKSYMHPIVHYFYKMSQKKGPINASSYFDSLKNPNAKHDRFAITQWLIRALVNNIFVDGTGPTLKRIGKTIDDYFKNEPNPVFPLSLLRQNAGSRSLEVSVGLIGEKILSLKSKDNETLPLLTLLFSGGIQTRYEVEHMWPRAKMDTQRHIEKCDSSLSLSAIEFYRDHYDTFPNLQILNRIQNSEKGEQYFSEWVKDSYPKDEDRRQYQTQFAIPTDESLYEYGKFQDFYKARSELLKERLVDFFAKDSLDLRQ